MNKETIILKWKENGIEHERTVNRMQMLDLMKSIKTTFYDDNEISTILVDCIPNIQCIAINKDRNAQKDIPVISYINYETKDEHIIEIRRHHKIIWAILNKYCM